jgi:hypothetical protein
MKPRQAGASGRWRVGFDAITTPGAVAREIEDMSNWFADKLGPLPRGQQPPGKNGSPPRAQQKTRTPEQPRQQAAPPPKASAPAKAPPEPEKKKKKGWF